MSEILPIRRKTQYNQSTVRTLLFLLWIYIMCSNAATTRDLNAILEFLKTTRKNSFPDWLIFFLYVQMMTVTEKTLIGSLLFFFKQIYMCERIMVIIIMSLVWDVNWCPVSRLTTFLAQKRPEREQSCLPRAARETKILTLLVATVKWL